MLNLLHHSAQTNTTSHVLTTTLLVSIKLQIDGQNGSLTAAPYSYAQLAIEIMIQVLKHFKTQCFIVYMSIINAIQARAVEEDGHEYMKYTS